MSTVLDVKQSANNGYWWVLLDDGTPPTHPVEEIATQLYELVGPHDTEAEAKAARREIWKLLK